MILFNTGYLLASNLGEARTFLITVLSASFRDRASR
jgi:hypothetical protein